MEKLSCMFNEKHGTDITVVKIENDFFGHTITVSGLVTGKDLTNQLKDKYKIDDLLISSSMLRSEGDMFLDSMTVEEAEKMKNTKSEISDAERDAIIAEYLAKQKQQEEEKREKNSDGDTADAEKGDGDGKS